MADFNYGTGYVYSDVVLKDKNATPNTHEDITRLDLDMVDGRVQPYHDLGALKYYIVEPGDNSMYTVKTEVIPGFGGWAAGNYGILSTSNEAMLEEWGYDVGSGDNVSRSCMMLFTLKTLTVGTSYSVDYLLHQGGE